MQTLLLKNSAIYSISTFSQKAMMFLLLPFYTAYLTSEEYGIVSVVLASSFFWTVFFTLGLDGAIVRFYYNENYKSNFKTFAGTLIISIFAFSIFSFIILITAGRVVIDLFYSEIPLYPYAYLGLSILVFQPVYNFTLSFLQAKNQAISFAILSFVYFFLNIGITILSVVFLEMASVGYILSISVSYCISCITGLLMLRNEIRWRFNFQYLKDAISFSYPFIPHSFLAQASGDTDKFILNHYITTAIVGIYQVGYSIAYAIDILAQSIGRAFSPLFIQNLKDKSETGREAVLSSSVAILFVMFAFTTCCCFFIPDFIRLFFKQEFHQSTRIVPVLAFAFLHSGFYYVYSNPLFFDSRLVKYIPICTLASGGVTIALDFILIPVFGMIGAAMAVFTGRLILFLVSAFFAAKSDLIKWNYIPVLKGYFLSICVAIVVIVVDLKGFGLVFIGIKAIVFFLYLMLLSFMLWGNAFVFLQSLKRLIQKRTE